METITTLNEAIGMLGQYRNTELGSNSVTIWFENGRLLTSYGKKVAVCLHHDSWYIVGNINYSRTTARHVNAFFKLTEKEFKNAIITGRIQKLKNF